MEPPKSPKDIEKICEKIIDDVDDLRKDIVKYQLERIKDDTKQKVH